MAKKKRPMDDAAVAESMAIEAPSSTDQLKVCLEEIKDYEGVVGYILRNSTSATIDLKDPSKLIDYAILSSSALDAGEELLKIFNLGDFKDILVEGKNVSILSLTVNENKISVFLEKSADPEKVLGRLASFRG